MDTKKSINYEIDFTEFMPKLRNLVKDTMTIHVTQIEKSQLELDGNSIATAGGSRSVCSPLCVPHARLSYR